MRPGRAPLSPAEQALSFIFTVIGFVSLAAVAVFLAYFLAIAATAAATAAASSAALLAALMRSALIAGMVINKRTGEILFDFNRFEVELERLMRSIPDNSRFVPGEARALQEAINRAISDGNVRRTIELILTQQGIPTRRPGAPPPPKRGLWP